MHTPSVEILRGKVQRQRVALIHHVHLQARSQQTPAFEVIRLGTHRDDVVTRVENEVELRPGGQLQPLGYGVQQRVKLLDRHRKRRVSAAAVRAHIFTHTAVVERRQVFAHGRLEILGQLTVTRRAGEGCIRKIRRERYRSTTLAAARRNLYIAAAKRIALVDIFTAEAQRTVHTVGPVANGI